MKSVTSRIAILSILALILISACTHVQEPTSNTILSGDNTLQYEIHGRGDQTLLLVHGWSNSHHVWDDQVKIISEDYRVVVLDLPGFGKSQNNRGSWTMDAFGKDVATLVNHLDLKEVILVGFSMGGPISIEAAKQVPHKIRGIVLVDVLQNPEATYSKDMIATITHTYMDTVTEPTLDKVKPWFKTKQEELGQKYINMVKDAPKKGWKESLHNCMVWLNRSSVESIQSLNIPILAINADQYPTDEIVFRKYNPAFKARIIEGVYHVVFWESPEQFNRYLRESIADIQQLSKSSSG